MPSQAFFLSQRLPHTHNQQEIKPIGGYDVAGKLNQWGINHRGQVATLENGERFLVHKGPGFGHNSQTVVVDANQMSRKWTPHGLSMQPGSQSVGLGDLVRAGGKHYNTFTNNCIHGACKIKDRFQNGK
ncbi:unnamed protein product [Rotaria sp. Silwood1]|nr:unnamed protein product [Rotaria sp. Silwood1]